MKARARTALTTGFLLVTAAAVAAVAWFGVHLNDAERARKELAGRKVLAVVPAEVRVLHVQAKGDDVRLQRGAGDAWRITAPLDAAPDPAAVRSMLDALAGLERRGVSAAAGAKPEVLRSFGLDAPSARIEAVLADGRTERLALGDTTGFDGAMFVMPTDGRVVVVADAARRALEQGLTDLRDKRVLPVEEADVARLELTTPKGTCALERANGGWRLAKPVADAADEGAVSRILLAVRELRAQGFPTGTAAATGAPELTVRIGRKDGQVVGFTAAKPAAPGAGEPTLTVRRLAGGDPMTVAASALAPLETDLFALRDKRVLRFDRDAVARVRVSAGASRFEVKRSHAQGPVAGSDVWTLPDGKAAEGWRVSGLVYGLAALDAVALVDEAGGHLAESGLDRPRQAVALLDANGKELAQLLVGRERDGRVRVKAAGSPRVWEVESARLSQLPQRPEDLLPRAAAAADAAGHEGG